jgi:fumarate hydratase class I
MASVRPLVLELIRHTSCGLPEDVLDELARARDREEPGSRAYSTFERMIQNVEAAREANAPICQDTGTLIFYVDYGPDFSPHEIERDIVGAVRAATKKAYLRPNAVDAITGENSGDNVGVGSPYIHFHPRRSKGLRIRLMMKGGGCENVGAQYSLPDESIGAGRDLDGVRRCIIDAVQKAQGYGCAPGTVGVGVGGDRVTSYMESKEQLFRPLHDRNPNPTLAALEEELTQSLQGLGIGPMGFGGKTTILGVKIGARHRVPASFFVSVSYMCWAYRKGELEIKGDKVYLSGRRMVPATPKRAPSRIAAKAVKKAAKTMGKAKSAAKSVAKSAKSAKVGAKTAKAKAATKVAKAKAAAKVAKKSTAKAAKKTTVNAKLKAPKIPSRQASRRKSLLKVL